MDFLILLLDTELWKFDELKINDVSCPHFYSLRPSYFDSLLLQYLSLNKKVPLWVGRTE